MKPLNYYEAIGRVTPGESVSEDTITVPNQALSIRDLVTRFSRGQEVEGARPHYFDNSEDLDNTDPTLRPDFDLSDATKLRSELQFSINERKKQAEAKRKAAEDALNEELAEFRKAKAEREKEAIKEPKGD